MMRYLGLSLRLAWRLSRSRRYGSLQKFMSAASTLGIAVGVMALITGLSAMNGFEEELKNRVLSLIPSAELGSATPAGFAYLEDDLKVLAAASGVIAAAPVRGQEGVLAHGGNFAPVSLQGIVPEKERKVISAERFASCSFDALTEAVDPAFSGRIILGAGLLTRLNLKIGDSVDFLAAPGQQEGAPLEAAAESSFLSRPADRRFVVAGSFAIGGQLDGALAFTALDTLDAAPNTIHLRIGDYLKAPEVATACARQLPEGVYVSSWFSSQGKLYHDITMIREIMYLAMFLVMAVACFNIISGLIMQVGEKIREIAILRTMGASRGCIVLTFSLMGLLSGLKGTLIGLAAGIALALGLTPLMQGLENCLDFKFLNPQIYFIDFIPSRLLPKDVIMVVLTALVMSLGAAIYPALKASRIDPARELNG